MSKDLIVKANALVEASYYLTANEQRLILSAIAQVPKNGVLRDDRIYLVNADDFIALGVHPKTAYREMEEAIQRLFDRMITIKNNGAYLKTRWVQSIGKVNKEIADKLGLLPANELVLLDKKSLVYGIQFSHQVLPFLTNLTANFTKYKLTEIAGFSSHYSYRFYEFIMQFQSTGITKISLNDLRQRLDLGDKYKATRDLNRWVIETAIKEINERSPYNVEYTLLKTGKKFTHLELKFKKKETAKNNKNQDQTTANIDLDNLTDQEHDIIAQKQAYAQQKGITDPLHIQNLINQGIIAYRDALQAEQEAKERKKAERQAQKAREREQLELAQQQYEQILASDTLINAYIANNINPQKMRASLQKMRYEQGDFRGVFELEKNKFEDLSYFKSLNLKFLDKINS